MLRATKDLKVCTLNINVFNLKIDVFHLKKGRTKSIHCQGQSKPALETYSTQELALCFRGHAFFSANAELLDQYAACATGEDVISTQNAWLEALNSQTKPVPEGTHLGLRSRMSARHDLQLQAISSIL